MIGLLGGCGAKEKGAGAVLEPGQSDLEYVQSKGTLLIGVTDFPPVDYKEGDSWGALTRSLPGPLRSVWAWSRSLWRSTGMTR